MRHIGLGGEKRVLVYGYAALSFLEDALDLKQNFTEIWEPGGVLASGHLPKIDVAVVFLQAGLLHHYGNVEASTVYDWLDSEEHATPSLVDVWTAINSALDRSNVKGGSKPSKKKRLFPGTLRGGPLRKRG